MFTEKEVDIVSLPSSSPDLPYVTYQLVVYKSFTNHCFICQYLLFTDKHFIYLFHSRFSCYDDKHHLTGHSGGGSVGPHGDV